VSRKMNPLRAALLKMRHTRTPVLHVGTPKDLLTADFFAWNDNPTTMAGRRDAIVRSIDEEIDRLQRAR
jgi:hypothetical protein